MREKKNILVLVLVVALVTLGALPSVAASSPTNKDSPVSNKAGSQPSCKPPCPPPCGLPPPTGPGTERASGISTSLLSISIGQLPCNMPSLPSGSRPTPVPPLSGTPTKNFVIVHDLPSGSWLSNPDGSRTGF